MVDALVIDASALCKLIRREPESEQVGAKVREQLERGGEVWTDPIAAIEIVTCARKAVEAGEGTSEQVAAAVQDALIMATMRPRSPGPHDMLSLIELACETGLSGPDARYVELALGNSLLSFDAKQTLAARQKGIRIA
ncbi:MAG: type II toxin-antitoxin system VapC family toxin [Thermoplasmatota archaeon]